MVYCHLSHQIPAYVLVANAEKAVYTIEGLKPFSSYIIAVSCILSFGHWSDWSMETTGTTQESGNKINDISKSFLTHASTFRNLTETVNYPG